MSRLTRFFAVTRVKFLRYDPFQAKFRRVMAVLGKSQSVNTANAKGWTSDLLMGMVSFLELFNRGPTESFGRGPMKSHLSTYNTTC